MKTAKIKLQNAECGIRSAGLTPQPPPTVGRPTIGAQATEPTPNPRVGTLGNEKGIALVLVLVLSVIALGIMTGLVYMLSSGTQVSGIQKRYKTAFEAGKGGTIVIFQTIGARGNPNIPLANFTLMTDPCLTDKLTKATANWNAACDTTLPINPATATTYDMKFEIGADPVYTVYTKIVDTVEGNSAPDSGLIKSGVVATNTGEVTVKSVPYLYTIEVDAENASNPVERAKLAVLYQY